MQTKRRTMLIGLPALAACLLLQLANVKTARRGNWIGLPRRAIQPPQRSYTTEPMLFAKTDPKRTSRTGDHRHRPRCSPPEMQRRRTHPTRRGLKKGIAKELTYKKEGYYGLSKAHAHGER
jgi:hypothetical protein